MQQLARVVPLVDGVRDVEALVALQADQPGAERARERLGQLGLADPGLALQQQRLLDRQRQEEGRREPPLGQVGLREERVLELVDGLEAHAGRHAITLANIGRSASNDNRWTCPGRVMYKSPRPVCCGRRERAFMGVVDGAGSHRRGVARGGGRAPSATAPTSPSSPAGRSSCPRSPHGRLQPRRALLIGRAGLSGVSTEQGRTTIGATTTIAELARRGRAAGHLRARPRRPRDPRAGDARRQPVRAAGRRDARAATCRPRCSRSTRRCARPAPAASAPSRSRTSWPRAPRGRLVLDVEFADPEAGVERDGAPAPRPRLHDHARLRRPRRRRAARRGLGRRADGRAQPRRRGARWPTAPTPRPRPPSACSTT